LANSLQGRLRTRGLGTVPQGLEALRKAENGKSSVYLLRSEHSRVVYGTQACTGLCTGPYNVTVQYGVYGRYTAIWAWWPLYGLVALVWPGGLCSLVWRPVGLFAWSGGLTGLEASQYSNYAGKTENWPRGQFSLP